MDHFSRKLIAVRVFVGQPTGEQVAAVLEKACRAGGAPKHIISDKGGQYRSDAYENWALRHGVKRRYGRLGQHGSIALSERVILTLKAEALSWLLVPLCIQRMQAEVDVVVLWYNRHRPHGSLNGATPGEVFAGLESARDGPRYEPRRRYPLGRAPLRGAPAAVRGQRGDELRLVVDHVGGRRHLPIVEMRRVA